jgi:hypothetical protein
MLSSVFHRTKKDPAPRVDPFLTPKFSEIFPTTCAGAHATTETASPVNPLHSLEHKIVLSALCKLLTREGFLSVCIVSGPSRSGRRTLALNAAGRLGYRPRFFATSLDSSRDIVNGMQTQGVYGRSLNVLVIDDVGNETTKSVLAFVNRLCRTAPPVKVVPTVLVMPDVYHKSLYTCQKRLRTFQLSRNHRRYRTEARDVFLKSRFDVRRRVRGGVGSQQTGLWEQLVSFGVDCSQLAFDNISTITNIATASEVTDLVADLDCLGNAGKQWLPSYQRQVLPAFAECILPRLYTQTNYRKAPRIPRAVIPRPKMRLISALAQEPVQVILDKLAILGPMAGYMKLLITLESFSAKHNRPRNPKTQRALVTRLQHGFFRKMRPKSSNPHIWKNEK